METNEQNRKDGDMTDAVRTFAKIGFLSFGGPAAQISVMHQVLVDEKRWLSERQFLHALNFCMLLPGPEAMQLATYAGWRLGGVRLGLIAGLLFIMPGLVMMLALSALYVTHGDVPAVAGILYGLKAAVLAVVIQALVKVSRRALKSSAMVAVAVIAFVAIAFLKVPFPIIILIAGLAGALLHMISPALLGLDAGMDESGDETVLKEGGHPGRVRITLIWLAIWLVPLATLFTVLGKGDVFADAALFFSQTAIVTFGGAYAVLAHVGQQAVEAYNWLSPDDMLKGLGLAETTLGPLVLVLVFVGFLAGASSSGMDPLLGGLLAGLVAAFFTFVPCFLWIFAGAPHVERLRHVRWLAASLAAVTAAVVGVIANLALWFGLNVLFGAFDYWQIGPLHIPQPGIANMDWAALAIGVAAGIALLRFRLGLFAVLGGAALAGLIVTLAG